MKTKQQFKKIAGIGCTDGECPAIYRSDDGRYFVRGYDVPKKIETHLNTPAGESLVEVPKELLEKFAEK